jgi:ABC-type glycerol-3-phosphate transport system substrate-binding protein
MMIKREVFPKFAEQYPHLKYKPDHVGQAHFDGSRYIHAYFDTVIDQGMVKKNFAYKFVAFPKAPGVDRVPAAGSMPGLIVSTTTKYPEAAAYLAWLCTTAEVQEVLCSVTSSYPNRKGVVVEMEDPHWGEVAAVVEANGMLDLGITLQNFAEIRAQGFPRVQKMYTGEYTPEKALREYVEAVDKILAR